MAKIAKKVAKAREGIDRNKLYGLEEAVKMVKARASAKFDETVEIAMNLGVDPRHADQMVETTSGTLLPLGEGHAVRVIVHHDGQPDFFLKHAFQGHRGPVGNVG